jgi:hypothetical protein
LSFLVDCFLLEVCQFQLTISFSRVVKCVVFQELLLVYPIPTQIGSAQSFALHPPKGGEIFPPLIWPQILSRKSAIFTPAELWFPPELIMCCSHLEGLYFYSCNWVSSRIVQALGTQVCYIILQSRFRFL